LEPLLIFIINFVFLLQKNNCPECLSVCLHWSAD